MKQDSTPLAIWVALGLIVVILLGLFAGWFNQEIEIPVQEPVVVPTAQ